jgi:ABC-2 type transport system permease protein
MTQALHSLTQAWQGTVRAMLTDIGVLLLMVLAPVLYAVYYPWPYTTQTVTRVPVMVVDQEHSVFSRQITRWAAASPWLEVVGVVASEQQAQVALWRGEIEGYAILPAGLKRQLLRGQAAPVTVAGNGAYALLNKAVLTGFTEVVASVSAGIELRQLETSGQSALQAGASRSPLSTVLVPLFNPTEGYGSYVVPAVALLILQQTLLMGTALLVGTWVETVQHRANAVVWCGRILGLSSVGFAVGLLFFGWVFLLQDYPRGGNPWGAVLLLLLYVPAVCSCGAWLGVWFGNRERALQVLLFTALPLAFLSGFSWPAEALPHGLRELRWLAPSTAAIQASLRLNQMGASIQEVWPELACLMALALGNAGLLLALAGQRPVSAAET